MRARRRIIILGSTGSIGTQAVEVVRHLRERGEACEIVGLAAGGRQMELLASQAAEFGVKDVAVADPGAAGVLEEGVRVRTGPDAPLHLVREVECDLVLAAMVGVAGLPATLAAVGLGRDVALANKETLVAAGGLVVPLARERGARLLPVDSEHFGVWQAVAGHDMRGAPPCPPFVCGPQVARVILTASGGPFRRVPLEEVEHATPAAALNHPTWSMGPKVTIDSASLMNKALELIEAHWLFGLGADRLDALIHPQSIIHALVEYSDGAVIAQLGAPDMRTPIQGALSWPSRVIGCGKTINWKTLRSLELEPVDPRRFPAVGLALRAIGQGGTSGAILNAANEAAVEAFLSQRVCFGKIARLVERALDEIEPEPLTDLEACMEADRRARDLVHASLEERPAARSVHWG